jgi:putative flavoprotein involved in K+ transport
MGRRYDSLKLNTPRLLSYMPRYRMPRGYGRWPGRDDLVVYLRDYVRDLGLRVQPRTEVQRIDRADSGWVVRTSAGALGARCAVVATGHNHDPCMPDWPGPRGLPR